MTLRLFPHPEPRTPPRRIRPVFLPLAGCPARCVYCNQPLQTGRSPQPLHTAYAGLERDLEQAAQERAEPFELAFYGGTFTALPDEWSERFISLAARYRSPGPVLGIRCSTRPDAVDTAGLARLADLGLDTVELGVQSFQDRVLERSGRGYDAQAALAACAAVKAAGLTLGVQCMPGLPGMTAADFLRDVEILCGVRPAMARLYPCLVLDGSALAGDFRRGAFRPWSLDRTLHCLTLALPRLWSASVRVIRMGLAPEAGLTGRVLAGPAHPALGQMARSRALLTVIRAQAAGLGRTPQGLRVPRPRMGELFGQRNELAPAYARLGLPRHAVQPWPLSLFCLY